MPRRSNRSPSRRKSRRLARRKTSASAPALPLMHSFGFAFAIMVGVAFLFQFPDIRANAASRFQEAQATTNLTLLAQRNDAQRGNQIVVNGTTLPVEWSIWNGQVGISDVGLMQLVGVELLDTRDPQQQPVRWFTDPVATPLILRAWNDGQFRYLDMSSIATTFNWRFSLSGGSLQIQTPTAQVLNVRQGRQSWGDRFVIDLAGPTTWQVTEQTTGVEISVDGAYSPATPPTPTRSGNTFQGYQVSQRGTKTVIQIQGTSGVRPVAFTLPNPNRLVVDLRSEVFPNRDIQWSPGIRWRSQLLNLGDSTFPVIWLEINPRQSDTRVRPIWGNPNGQPGITPLTTMARQNQAAAAINAGFFNRNNQLPLGAIRRESRWFSGPILNRGAIGWNERGDAVLDRLTLGETIRTSQGSTVPIFSLNSGYVGTGVSRYTPEWGPAYTPILANETIFTVRRDQIVSQGFAPTAGQGSFPVPQDGYLLVSRGSEAIANTLPTGTTLQIQQGSNPAAFDSFPQVLGAGPLLIQNRRVVLNGGAEQFTAQFVQQRAVRSAIARTADGNILLVAGQNRIGGRGPTLLEWAQLMQQLGATDALNLDGGSSTSLYLGGRLINRSPLTAARVHNGIGVFAAPPQ
ncbi:MULTISPECIES: phosphodiester glycosidase family protein [unclassified Leptolyngbya]|uniref:phosphodiester glycosidase family protein n=1 Tax=unclassified Leptolyngbya TaxID=2650499 RepID=UPI0018F045BA|nr:MULTISPECIES: phosphodiester glycosidase family protein [unclassified Leptolyngbya]